MSISSPFLRTFTVGGVWFAAVALKMVSRHSGHWSTYPPRNFVVLVVAWVITALILGAAASRFERLRSWWGIGLGTVVGSFVVLGLMLFTVEKVYGTASPKFSSTEEMMVYFANETTKWVKADRSIDLDYSLDSIKLIEEELGRISKEVDKANPKPGTVGLATGYGAYVGEVLRQRDGGTWSVDHSAAGPRSYPLTVGSNNTIFPVGWCWKRLTGDETENVYRKALVFEAIRGSVTNTARVK
ncbi:MAG TPA: hypothetical protein VN887_01645 [Candidatus Angelobacter sp.]|nr:hypothetical protein [Candidatus Angelobacter sp.]